MSVDSDALDLSQALHRKLLNYGRDIRAYRKRPSHAQDESELRALRENRSVIDRTYSACIRNLQEQDPQLKKRNYDAHKDIYTRL